MQIIEMTGLSYPPDAAVGTGSSFAPEGKTPVAMAQGGARQKLSMSATVTNQGKPRWMIIDAAFDADKLSEFLQALIKDAGKKVFLILDNLRVNRGGQTHAAHKLRQSLAQRRDDFVG